MFAKITYLSLIYQNTIDQNLNFWLVIAGILILFICCLALFIPKIKEILSSQQEFNGLGLSMRVSILTVFVVMGFVLSLSSFALQWQGYITRENEYKNKIAALETERNELRDREARGRKFNMNIILKPMGYDEVLNTDEWKCFYFLEDSFGTPSEKGIAADLKRVRDGKSFKVSLEDITPETRFHKIELRKGDKIWSVEGIFPLRDGTFHAEPEQEDEDNDN